jgi:hypothetical protein
MIMLKGIMENTKIVFSIIKIDKIRENWYNLFILLSNCSNVLSKYTRGMISYGTNKHKRNKTNSCR